MPRHSAARLDTRRLGGGGLAAWRQQTSLFHGAGNRRPFARRPSGARPSVLSARLHNVRWINAARVASLHAGSTPGQRSSPASDAGAASQDSVDRLASIVYYPPRPSGSRRAPGEAAMSFKDLLVFVD